MFIMTFDGNHNMEDRATEKWSFSGTEAVHKDWPRIDGQPEEAVFLKHCGPLNMADDMLVTMLGAYGIPAVKLYPGDGAFGKVILGMSGGGTNIFVPKSMYEDALALLKEEVNGE